MNALFLDVDGVLNSETFLRVLDERHRQLGHHEACECFRLERQIDPAAIVRLNRLVASTHSKIVISSSWRLLMDPSELHRVLSAHGLVAEIIGETPDLPNELLAEGPIDRIERGHEIAAWLQRNPGVDRFVILDDCSDMAHLKHRLVQTDSDEGLLDEHVDLALRMMSWDGKTLGETASPGSSVGLYCNHDQHLREGYCPEKLSLSRKTVAQPTHEDDYHQLMPALDAAAVLIGWRLYRCVWWCPTHVVAKNLACRRCLSACPSCMCPDGPFVEAVDGIVVEVTPL